MKKYITKPIDYTGCNRIIASHLKHGESIECFVSDRVDIVGTIRALVVGYRAGNEFAYVTGGHNGAFRCAIPITTVVTETRVKKASEIVKWLEDNGYFADATGFYSVEKPVFDCEMFEYCGSEPCSDYRWHPDWIEEIEVTGEENP